MNIDDIKKIHCVGVGGIGVSAIVRFFLARGVKVSGSDMVDSDELTALSKRGCNIFFLQAEGNISEKTDVIVYSPAIPEDNVELQVAKKRKIPTFSYPEMLGKIMNSYTGIAVSGTNGKTTTTALLGKFLEAGGKDPTVIIGGRVPGWDNNLRVGSGDLFVAEGCEYKRSMLELSPQIIVLTNIERDHLDYYKDINDIIDAFTEYVSKLKKDDLLVYNIDDKNCRDVASKTPARKISFGLTNNADIYAQNVTNSCGEQSFELVLFGKVTNPAERNWQATNPPTVDGQGRFVAKIPGVFNVYNILGAVAVAFDLGVENISIQQALNDFTGIWRRFEWVGQIDNAVVVSDYAHHPTSIRGTLRGAREFFPDKKILAVFQPHHQDRTLKLFDGFVKSFTDADEVIVAEIYHVCGREEEKDKISSESLVSAIKKHNPDKKISYAKNIEVAEDMVREQVKDFDVILIMGAGDIDKIARNLVSKK